MLNYPPGEFSSTTLHRRPSCPSQSPMLHWNFANRRCNSHHHNFRVTNLRFESAFLPPTLTRHAIGVSQLADLQGVTAPPTLVQLIESLGRNSLKLTLSSSPQ